MKLILAFLFLLLWPLFVSASTAMNGADLYFGSEATRDIDAIMIPDPTHLDSGWYLIKMRWKSTIIGYTTYGCTVASLNDWIAAVNGQGMMTLSAFVNAQTPHGHKWAWDNVLTMPDPTMDPWCLQ